MTETEAYGRTTTVVVVIVVVVVVAERIKGQLAVAIVIESVG